jgi:quercetin dioxygenase-like cupin family protein
VRSDLRLGDPGLLIEKGSPQMNRRADVAQDHKTCGVREEDTRKGVIHLSPGEGKRSLWVFGELMTHKVAGHSTGGAYALFGVTTPPGAGPPPHVQHREDESFYVLEGEYEFLVEGSTLSAEAGSLLYVRKGTLHAHKSGRLRTVLSSIGVG